MASPALPTTSALQISSAPRLSGESYHTTTSRTISIKYRCWLSLALLCEVMAYVCLFLAWSGNGHDRTYIDLDGFSLGGLGYCEEYAQFMKKVPPWIFQVVLWGYLSIACIGSASFLLLSYYWMRKGKHYHKLRALQLGSVTIFYCVFWGLSMICALITDVELRGGFILSIATLTLLVLATLVQIRIYFYDHSKGKHDSSEDGSPVEPSRRRYWIDPATTIADFLGIVLGSQFWSCLAAIFYIGVNVMIMIHDFRTEPVQRYITNDIVNKYAGVKEYADAHPMNFGENATCSHFPTSNISTQGNNIESIALFFVYHIGLCCIAVLLIIDELCDIRFGILGPQQNKTGAAWTAFYLFTATMSRSIIFWCRAYIQTVKVLSWTLVAVACIHILSHHMKVRQWKSSGKPLGVTSSDRHARIRTGRAAYRGPLKIPFIHKFQLFEALQRRIGEGDPDMRVCATEMRSADGSAQIMSWALGSKEVGGHRVECIIPPNIDHKLGMKSCEEHCRSPYSGGFIKPFNKENQRNICSACDQHHCNTSRLALPRGFPLRRGDVYRWWVYGMDLRRFLCVLFAFLLFLIQFSLCFNELSLNARWNFQVEAEQKREVWGARKGVDINKQSPLLPSECSYFDYSSIPIAYYGKGDHNAGVLLTVATVGLNKTFLMGMCISVMLVSLTNNRYWGQSIVVGVFSLIGPRLSSISVGLTLIHVSISTLSQSLFADREQYCVTISRIICYIALGVGLSSCVCTEDLSGKRDGLTSDSAWFKTLFNRKKHHRWDDDAVEMTDARLNELIAENG